MNVLGTVSKVAGRAQIFWKFEVAYTDLYALTATLLPEPKGPSLTGGRSSNKYFQEISNWSHIACKPAKGYV